MQEINDAISQWWVYALSSLGGLVGYGQDFNLEDTCKIQTLKLFNRMTTAIFAGVMTLLLCKALAMSLTWTFLAVGIGAWRGIRGLQVISDFIDKKFGKGVDGSEK